MTPPHRETEEDTRLLGVFPIKWLKNPTFTLLLGIALASGGWNVRHLFPGQTPAPTYDLQAKCQSLSDQIIEIKTSSSKTDYRTALVENRLDRIEAKLDRLIEHRLAQR